MKYLTKTEEQIIKFLEKYKSITITQCSNIFYNHMKNNYRYAASRLSKLENLRVIKRTKFKSRYTGEYIYYLKKPVSDHNNYPIYVMSNIIKYGGEVTLFELSKEYNIKPKKIKPDAFIIYKYNNKKKGAFIEINFSHIASIKRYERLFENGIIEKEYGGFPNIITIGLYKDTQDSNNFTVLNFDIKMEDFKEKLLSL